MTDGAILVHFNDGSIDLDVPVIFLPGEGTKNVIDWNCIKFPEVEDLRTRFLESNQIYKLPFKFIINEDGKWGIETTKLLFFNRVAKTGSQALIALLVDLQEKNKFKATIDITMKGKEYVMEPKERVATQVNKVSSMARTGLNNQLNKLIRLLFWNL